MHGLDERRPFRRVDWPATSSNRMWAIVGLLGAIALCWILITPPGAGPDEPSHLTRSASLAYGQLNGEYLTDLSLTGYDLPDEYLLPDPACYAIQHPDIPVSCAAPAPRSGATIQLASRADEYPLPGHLTYGLASRLPGLDPVWWARLAGAAAGVALIGASMRARPGIVPWAGIVVALTPMAWSTMTTVNPSAFGVPGAVALWTALLALPSRATAPGLSWLSAAGWVALALPRRDGLIWACLILVVALAATDRGPVEWGRGLGLGPGLVIAAATAATLAWGITSDRRVSQMVVLSPLIIVGAVVARRVWVRSADTRRVRGLLVAGSGMVGALLIGVLLVTRPGGWDGELTRAVIGQTDANLEEAIGVLGWLDTTLPLFAVIAAVCSVVLLAIGTMSDRRRPLLVAGVVLALAVVTSWVFELYQGNTSARYWQGRYSLPLLVGIPISLTALTAGTETMRRLARAAGLIALVVLNIAIWAAARRWGVGVDGTLIPWRWATVHSPLDPFVVLIFHAAATTGLAVALFGPSASGTHGAVGSRTPDDGPPLTSD